MVRSVKEIIGSVSVFIEGPVAAGQNGRRITEEQVRTNLQFSHGLTRHSFNNRPAIGDSGVLVDDFTA